MLRSISLKLAIAMSLFAVGCVGETEQINTPNTEEVLQGDGFALLDGLVTTERSEVGYLRFGNGLCTATLISPRVAVTARHCVGYTSCRDDACASAHQPYVVFQNPERPNHHDAYKVIAFESYDKNGVVEQGSKSERIGYFDFSRHDYWLSDDVAIVLLKDAVPSNIAKPTPLLERDGESGESWTIWGYGCTDRDTRQGSQTKRLYDFVEGSRSNNLCPGDSGGPVTLGRRGAVRYVNSAYTIEQNPRDVFGDILHFKDLIDVRLEAWKQTLPDPTNPVEKDPWVGDTCSDHTQCNFASGADVGMCQANQSAGFCTLSCQGYCPDLEGNAPTFCVGLGENNTGACVAQAHDLNAFCGNMPGFVAKRMNRFIGNSGARNATKTVCVPEPITAPEPPKTLSAPTDLLPDKTVKTQHVDFQWSPVGGANNYKVNLFYYNGTSWRAYHTWKTNSPGLRVWPVLKKHSYYFNVEACKDQVCSQASTPQSFYFAP